MKKSSLIILLVDDTQNVKEEVELGLGKIGVTCKIDYYCPTRRDLRFGGCKLPEGKAFDDFDLALIDLELFYPWKNDVNPSLDDLRGGSEILPYVREQAPWLPAIAYSRHFETALERFFPVACSFGFDGYLPRGLFSSKAFSRPLWEVIYQRSRLLRLRAVLGESFQEDAKKIVELRHHPSVTAPFPGWQDVLKRMFHFTETVVLTPMQGGWSGAFALQAFAKQDQSLGGREGQWLVKLSENPSKLHRELQAHLRMARSGVDFARMAQPLWPNVVNESGCAAIAFQFAHGTEEAATILSSKATRFDEVMLRVTRLLHGFYGQPNLTRNIVGNLTTPWSSSREVLEKAADLIKSSNTERLLRAIAAKSQECGLGKNVEFHQTLIHGDLHLGNIMLGDRDILIDFSRSNPGPLAVDLARLAADIVVRVPALRGAGLPAIRGSHSDPVVRAINEMGKALDFTSGDELLFDIFLRVFLARHLTYPDKRVPPDTKAWITAGLKSLT